MNTIRQKSTDELKQILNEELESFISVLQFSEKFLSEVHSLPVNIISRMVDYRQEWIEKIQKLEDRRKKLDTDPDTEEVKVYLREIAQAARQLVEIDQQIYRELQKRKLEFVREHSEIVEQTNYQKKLEQSKGHISRRLDITRE